MAEQTDYVIEDGKLIKYKGKDVELNVPDGINTIGYAAFSRKEKIESVILPKSVTKIEDEAFWYCINLNKVEIQGEDVEIGSYAFSGCDKLAVLDIKGSISKVGSHAFFGCWALKENLDYFVINDELIHYYGEEENICVPEGIRVIHDYAFAPKHSNESHILSVDIPEGVETIGECAFKWAYKLEKLVLPSTINEIGKDNFKESYKMKKLVIGFEPRDAKYAAYLIDKVFDIRCLARLYLERKITANDLFLAELKKKVVSKAFRQDMMSDYIYQNNVELATALLRIGKKIPLDELDDYINKAEKAEIQAALLEYKNSVYDSEEMEKAARLEEEKELDPSKKSLADWRKTFTVSKVQNAYKISTYKGTQKEVFVPAKIKEIPVLLGAGVFDGNAKIERVILEGGLRSIPPFMFSGCKNLEEVELPESVTAIAAWSFNGCRKLKKITFERKDKINITELFTDCPDLVFYGHKDSYIQKYAEENSIPFEVLE